MKKLLAFALLTSTILLSACLSPPEGIEVAIAAPETVAAGDFFDVTVTIANQTEETQTLTSIDIDTDYLEGISLIDSTPLYADSWDLSLIGIMSYDYYSDIPPGQSLEINFQMTGVLEGKYEGDLDVCINTETDCVFGTVVTEVE